MVLETLDQKTGVHLSRLSLARGNGNLYCDASNIAITPFELLTEFFWASLWQRGIERADRTDEFIREVEEPYIRGD